MIIDCHAHIARTMTGFWEPLRYGKALDRGQARQIFPPAFDPTASPPEVLLGYMDQAGVDRAILLQHHLYGDQNEVVLAALEAWPDRLSGFAYLGPIDQPDAPDQLERLLERGMTGLKIEVPSTRRLRADFAFDGEREWRVFERLSQLRRPLALDLNGSPPEDVIALRQVTAAFPTLPVLICHVGGPPGPGWQDRALLAKVPQGWVDLAALPMFAGPEEEYPYPRAQEYVRWAVETFGAERVLWGTDYPPALNRGTYVQHLDYLRRHCDFLTSAQKTAILGGNAERFLKSGS